MTIAKSLLSNESFYVDGFPVLEPAQDAPRFYRVMLQRKSDNVFVMGHVVTFLDLLDWCDWHGYDLFELQAGARQAYAHERTDLR